MNIPLFAHISAFSHVIPVYAGIKHWGNLQFPRKIFCLFFIFAVGVEIVEFTLGRLGIANQFVSNIYMLILVECIMYLYSKWIQKTFLKDGLKIVGLLYFVFWFLDVSYLPFPKEFRENIDTVANGIMLISSVVILGQMAKLSEQSITNYSIFWIALGTLLYSAGTIVVFSFSNTILAMGITYFSILWHINWGFTIIANILYARSFWCKIF